MYNQAVPENYFEEMWMFATQQQNLKQGILGFVHKLRDRQTPLGTAGYGPLQSSKAQGGGVHQSNFGSYD